MNGPSTAAGAGPAAPSSTPADEVRTSVKPMRKDPGTSTSPPESGRDGVRTAATTTASPPAARPTAERTGDKSEPSRRRRGGKDGSTSTAASPAARATRSTRAVVRRLDPWSVFKVSLVFYACMFLVLLTAAVLLWIAAQSAGVVENVESFMNSIGFTDFEFLPGQLLRATALGGLVLVLAGTAGNMLLSLLYNLLAEVVGGVTLTLDDDRRPRRRS